MKMVSIFEVVFPTRITLSSENDQMVNPGGPMLWGTHSLIYNYYIEYMEIFATSLQVSDSFHGNPGHNIYLETFIL